jgi:hypothetical protein
MGFTQNLLHKSFVWLFFFSMLPLTGQEPREYRTGAVLDNEKYNKTTAKPVLSARSYKALPTSASVKQFGPTPEDQGNHSTCVGWATAYAARTISESSALNRLNRQQTTTNAFSPIFVYKNISKDPNGQNGTLITDALDLMKKRGIVKRLPTEKTLDFKQISASMFNASNRFPISDYVRLFSNPRGEPGPMGERVPPVKKSLAEGKPVIIGMNTPPSFTRSRGLWQPTENPTSNYGGHAMCVVGYDDDKYEGAFEVQNSWGEDWGDEGYTWIRYSDFANFVYQAFEIIENLAIYKDAARFAASIKIEINGDSRGMSVTYDSQGFYKTRGSYSVGTQFYFLMMNRHPAYVYSFAADDKSPGTERIFPEGGTSPVLDYRESEIAWPDEKGIRLNNVAGTDYLIVLFSKEALDITAIERRFAFEKRGTFPERVAMAVGANLMPYGDVKYENNRMEFSAQSTDPKAVFALLLAIDHE